MAANATTLLDWSVTPVKVEEALRRIVEAVRESVAILREHILGRIVELERQLLS